MSFVVYVLDVQDSPPIFINLPYSVQIDEDTPVVRRLVLIDRALCREGGGGEGLALTDRALNFFFFGGDALVLTDRVL